MNATLRNAMLVVHRWTGLTVGLLLIFLAITGLALVFRPQLATVVDHELAVPACSTPLPLDDLIARAEAAHPQARLTRVEIASEGTNATMIRFADKEMVFVDPCSGNVLVQQKQWSGPLGVIEMLHRFRFTDVPTANFITGGTAIVASLLLVGLGLFVWWPATLRALKGSFKLRTHLKGRAFDLNLHRTVGVYTGVVILIVSLTSLPLAFVWVRDAINLASGSQKEMKPKALTAEEGAKPLSMGVVWERAQAVLDHPTKAVMEPVKKPDRAVEVWVLERNAPHPNAYTYVYLDPVSGKVLRVAPYATSSLGNKIYRWCASMHMGYVGGVPGQIALFLGILGVPVLGYSGVSSYVRRKFPAPAATPTLKVRVAGIHDEAQDVKSFELVSANGKPLPAFEPGAHVSVHVDRDLVRQYSICNAPTEKNRYVIAVKQLADSRGGSRALCERVKEGDVLSISAPRNHFPLDPNATHHVLIAGGIGITPLLSMLRHLEAQRGSFELHYFARSIEQMAFHDELSRPQLKGKVDFHYAIERERLGEYLHKLLWKRVDGAHVYVCGPSPFMEAVEAAAAHAYPPDAVHREYFRADPLASAGPSEPFEIALARSGCSYTVPSGKSIVNVLAENGIPTMTSCEQGVCGTCLAGVLEGVPEHRDVYLSDAEKKSCTKIMMCVSRAQTPRLVLDI
jgi:vanillate O-demethylase ferredoxin subunit